jgi:hypothetical protein
VPQTYLMYNSHFLMKQQFYDFSEIHKKKKKGLTHQLDWIVVCYKKRDSVDHCYKFLNIKEDDVLLMVMEKENNNNHNNMYHDKDQA